MTIKTRTAPQDTSLPHTALGRCSCRAGIAPRMRLALETIRSVARRPITPELLYVCRTCGRLHVVGLHPDVEGAS